MPGLLRGIARTAVISGTATAVSNRVSRRQAYRWAEQDAVAYDQSPPPPPPPQAPAAPAAGPTSGSGDVIEQLKQLGALHEQGVLTDEEFAAQKQKLLG